MVYESLNKLRPNRPISLQDFNKIKSKVPSGNPFKPYRKDGRIVWISRGANSKAHIDWILYITAKNNRTILINAGGHGGEDGSNPTNS